MTSMAELHNQIDPKNSTVKNSIPKALKTFQAILENFEALRVILDSEENLKAENQNSGKSAEQKARLFIRENIILAKLKELNELFKQFGIDAPILPQGSNYVLALELHYHSALVQSEAHISSLVAELNAASFEDELKSHLLNTSSHSLEQSELAALKNCLHYVSLWNQKKHYLQERSCCFRTKRDALYRIKDAELTGTDTIVGSLKHQLKIFKEASKKGNKSLAREMTAAITTINDQIELLQLQATEHVFAKEIQAHQREIVEVSRQLNKPWFKINFWPFNNKAKWEKYDQDIARILTLKNIIKAKQEAAKELYGQKPPGGCLDFMSPVGLNNSTLKDAFQKPLLTSGQQLATIISELTDGNLTEYNSSDNRILNAANLIIRNLTDRLAIEHAKQILVSLAQLSKAEDETLPKKYSMAILEKVQDIHSGIAGVLGTGTPEPAKILEALLKELDESTSDEFLASVKPDADGAVVVTNITECLHVVGDKKPLKTKLIELYKKVSEANNLTPVAWAFVENIFASLKSELGDNYKPANLFTTEFVYAFASQDPIQKMLDDKVKAERKLTKLKNDLNAFEKNDPSTLAEKFLTLKADLTEIFICNRPGIVEWVAALQKALSFDAERIADRGQTQVKKPSYFTYVDKMLNELLTSLGNDNFNTFDERFARDYLHSSNPAESVEQSVVSTFKEDLATNTGSLKGADKLRFALSHLALRTIHVRLAGSAEENAALNLNLNQLTSAVISPIEKPEAAPAVKSRFDFLPPMPTLPFFKTASVR